ncbi:hypothetical protein OBBRIDRAFT_808367 [Obba rivulosa]|uniref:Uncharacterized protein n=1 Tax=Obba rivulosa TaxID=1052685 RepID=A0A8E2DEU0_9APHY|nr:hypothetical protein OBBRIDRAFT_808367 [Obba rivulosa]
MPSLATVVSAIIGGCVLITLLLSYAIWSICRDQAKIQRQRRSRQRVDRYALQLLERNQRRARRTWPLSDEIRVAFPPGFSKDALTLSSQDLADVHISEELEMAELAEKVTRESRSGREPGAGSPPL